MNQQQRKYALTRVQEIHSKTIQRLHTENNKNNYVAAVSLCSLEKAKLITSGKIKPRKVIDFQYHLTLDDVFDFSKHEVKSHYKNQAAHEKKLARVQTITSSTSDEIMLGDAKGAMEAIDNMSKALALI